MDEVKVDMSGDMNVPSQSPKSFDFSSFTQFQNIPSPLQLIQAIRNSLRPWSEFVNTANFKSSASMPRLSGRFIRNIKHFQSNYIFIFIVLMIYCLITSPLILVVLACVGYACHRIKKNGDAVSICNHQLTVYQQISAINIAAVPILFLVGAGAALFWTLGASGFVIALHAIFYNIDAIVTEETEGFLTEVV